MTKQRIFLMKINYFFLSGSAQSMMTRAIDLWLKTSFTLSSPALLSVAFHQLSKTTSSSGHTSPSEWILRVLSGVITDIRRPVPHISSMVSVTGNMVSQSEMMSTVIPFDSRSYVLAYSMRREMLPMVWSVRIPVAPVIWISDTSGQRSRI